MARRYPTLAAYLQGTGQTQYAFARALNIQQGQLSLYVRRLREPRLSTALRISKVTGVPLEALTVPRLADMDAAAHG